MNSRKRTTRQGASVARAERTQTRGGRPRRTRPGAGTDQARGSGARRGSRAQQSVNSNTGTNGATRAVRKTITRAAPSGAVRAQPALTTLQLRIHKVVCEKTTRELLRKDDMSVAGIVAYGEVGGSQSRRKVSARARKGKTVALGKFGKNDVRSFSTPKVVAEHALGPTSADWPREYPAWLVLVEKDEGAVGKVVSTAVDIVDEKVVSLVAGAASTIAAGVAAGSALGTVCPGIGTAIGAGAGALTAAAMDALRKARHDEVFRLKSVVGKLAACPDTAGQLPGTRKTLTFRDHGGIYKVTLSWAVK